MGVAGPEHIPMELGEIEPGRDHREGGDLELEQGVLEEEPEIAGDLIVAGTAGVEPLADAPDPPGEPQLDR